jgi:predicted phosphoribosyltransferase
MIGFINREHAGNLLYEKLQDEKTLAEVVVALPRGGIPAGAMIARKMKLPLRLAFIRKIGHPVNPEYAIGAVSETDLILNDGSHYGTEYLKKEIIKERLRISEMEKIYKNSWNKYDVCGKHILLIDDGIATGTCMELAVKEMRENGASSIGIATPVCSYNAYKKLMKKADSMTCLLVTQNFLGIGSYYDDFTQLTDEMAIKILVNKKLPEKAALKD